MEEDLKYYDKLQKFTSEKVHKKEKLMSLVLIIKWNCIPLTVKKTNLIHLTKILTICLGQIILTMNSLVKTNLCKIFHEKFSFKNMLFNKQKLILTIMFFCSCYSFHVLYDK